MIESIGNWKTARHAYSVEVEFGHKVMVYADTRAQAARLARQSGYTIRSVNTAG